MGEVQSETPEVACVFELVKECPVRKAMHRKLSGQDLFRKRVEPIGDRELMKIYAPLIDKLQESFQNEFSVLSDYCAVCPIREGSKNGEN